MTLTVVIPALNEEAQVQEAVLSAFGAGATEVIVADGGSADATCDQARAAGAAVVHAAPGRAVQMNTGARQASGDVLLFLHADTRLTPEAGQALMRAYADPATQSTVFRLRFDRSSWLLRVYERATAIPYARIAFGDRALGVRRAVFEAVGGFAPIPVFEDLDLVQRLKRHGGLRFLPEAVVTSARRFTHNGPLRQQWLNLRLWVLWRTGTPPEQLAHLYRYDGARGET